MVLFYTMTKTDRAVQAATPLRKSGDPVIGSSGDRTPKTQDAQFISSSEQAPGPRGSPQDPQAPLALSVADDDFAPATAKRESCCSSLRLSRFGHLGVCDPITMVSK